MFEDPVNKYPCSHVTYANEPYVDTVAFIMPRDIVGIPQSVNENQYISDITEISRHIFNIDYHHLGQQLFEFHWCNILHYFCNTYKRFNS